MIKPYTTTGREGTTPSEIKTETSTPDNNPSVEKTDREVVLRYKTTGEGHLPREEELIFPRDVWDDGGIAIKTPGGVVATKRKKTTVASKQADKADRAFLSKVLEEKRKRLGEAPADVYARDVVRWLWGETSRRKSPSARAVGRTLGRLIRIPDSGIKKSKRSYSNKHAKLYTIG